MLGSLIAGLLVLAAPCRADDYPSHSIRIIVPFPAGGGADITIRIVGQKLSVALGQPIVIDNRPGAGGALAADLVAKAPADGYTLYNGTIGHAITAAMLPNLPYDAQADFAPISLFGQNPFVIAVNPGLAVNSLPDLLAYARQRPGQLNFANNGNGTLTYLVVELLKLKTGIDVVQVPYRGDNFSTADLMAGQVQAMFVNAPVALPHLKGGRMRGLAVTGTTRSASLPDLPTMAEAGVPDFQVSVWLGLMAPAKTPVPIIERLQAEIVRALKEPDLLARFADLGVEPISNTPAVFSNLIASEIKVWKEVVARSGAKFE